MTATHRRCTAIHNRHKADQAGFLRRGGSTLFAEEIELLEPLAGCRLLHLLCNSGQDTLSLVAHGARVTGVDISDEAIDFARRLAADSGHKARFERADVYDYLDAATRREERFDRVFLSYGALPWLSDLDALMQGAAGLLVPGGRLVIVEFHPIALCFNEARVLQYSYFSTGEPVLEMAGVEDYVGASEGALAPSGTVSSVGESRNPHPSYEFPWGLAQVVQAVLNAGLSLKNLQQLPYSNGWKIFEGLRSIGNRRFAEPAGEPQLPLMFTIAAEKPR